MNAQPAEPKTNATPAPGKTPKRTRADIVDQRGDRVDVPLATKAEVQELRADIARILQLLEPPANGGGVPNGAANPAVGPGAQQWPTGNNPPNNPAIGGAGPGLGNLGQLSQVKGIVDALEGGQNSGAVDANALLYRIMDSHLKLTDGITQFVIGRRLEERMGPSPAVIGK